MPARLIVCGSMLGGRIARAVAEWPGDIAVVATEDRLARGLRDAGIETAFAEVADADALSSVTDDVDEVIVTPMRGSSFTAALAASRRAFPAARLVAIAVDRDRTDDLADADVLIDADVVAGRELATRFASGPFWQTLTLMRTLRQIGGSLAIVMHDNPDPDAIGAAVGVAALAESTGADPTILYAGEITHQQNRAFVNLLDLELTRIDDAFDPASYDGIAIVDHAHPGVNDPLASDTSIDIVIDHHPAREEVDATFVDRRHETGATSTLVAQHLLEAGIDFDETLATALWYGIQVDTDGFRRGVSGLDFSIGAALHDHVDTGVVEQIESPRITADTLDTIGAAIEQRVIREGVVVTHVGRLTDRDALAQAADMLVLMEGVTTVCVFAEDEEMVYASARSRDDGLDVGDAMRLAFGRIGSAGGHEDMAGAQVPVGMIALDGDEATIGEVVTERFFEGVTMASTPIPSGFIEDEMDD